MPPTPEPKNAPTPEQREAPAPANARPVTTRLGVRDVVTVAICAVIAMVIYTVVGMLLTPIYGPAYPLVGPICVLFTAPLWVLATYRAPKHGSALLFFLIIALINALPGYWYMLPYLLIGGLVCEAILWKKGSYQNNTLNSLAFVVFAVMNSIGTFLPIWLFGPSYYEQLGQGEMGDLFTGYAFSPLGVAIGVITGAILALVGHWLGRKMLTKHFVKAGIVTR
ncbi:MAG: MptD family putative ECF transporter S component [Microbacteriaceae bacterium]|uniref:MptD family putative ECF transporter S component n=1 Tax=Brevibacterium sp. FAM 27836 TaxID=3446693 RepID=UPI003F516BB2